MDPSPSGNPSTTPESHPATPGAGSAGPSRVRRPHGAAAAAVAALAGGLLLAGCQVPTFGVHKAISTQGNDSVKLWQGFFIAGAIVFVLVFTLITWAVVRYRRRSDAVPRQTQYHTLLEIFYTAVPVVIVLILFAFTFVTENNVDALPAPKLSVNVTGFQWGWKFSYPKEHVTVIGVELQDPELVLPQNETVRISLASHDVIHGFYVPAFEFSRYLQPGVINRFTVNLHTLGTYHGQCTQFCGLYHSLMRFRVKVVSPAQFASWVRTQQSRGPSSSISTAEKRALANSTSYTTPTTATGGTGS